jgi:hypothetical protein
MDFEVAVASDYYKIGAYVVNGRFTAKNASLASVDQIFGNEDHCISSDRTGETIATWPSLGVRGVFATLGGYANAKGQQDLHGNGCKYRSEVQPDSLILTDPRWRTNLGLRVGDPVAHMYALYPAAAFHSGPTSVQGGWWLHTVRLPYAAGVDSGDLIATVTDQHITALTVIIGAEGE